MLYLKDQLHISNLTDEEQQRFATLLKTYFEWLGTEEECNASDVVEELQQLYSALPQID